MIYCKLKLEKSFFYLKSFIVLIAVMLGIGLIVVSSLNLKCKFITVIKNIVAEYKNTKDISGDNSTNLVCLLLILTGILIIGFSIPYIIGIARIILRIKAGFDEINIVKQGDSEISYGIIHGNNTVIFIKAGMNGTHYGYKNKYLTIAKNLYKKHGCTVITASNPNGYMDDFESEMKSIEAYAFYHKWTDFQVYYMGHSNGACLGMIHGYKYSFIKKMLLINGPLSINPQQIIPGLKSFNGEKMNLVYGSKDPTFSLLNKFSEFESDKIEITRINGASHNFNGALNLFIALPGFFFFGDKIKCKNVKVLSSKDSLYSYNTL